MEKVETLEKRLFRVEQNIAKREKEKERADRLQVIAINRLIRKLMLHRATLRKQIRYLNNNVNGCQDKG